MTGQVGVAYCYRHPDRETGVRCVRCDRPICPDCMRPASVGFPCPDDAREGARSIRAPRTTIGARVVSSPPYVTIALVALNLGVYLATALQRPGTLRNPTISQLFIDLQLNPDRVEQGGYYRLLTSAFLHFNPLHVVVNLISLVILGPTLERLLGRWRFTALYLLCSLGGGALVYLLERPDSFTAGASGAIYGLFGACLLLARRLQLDLQWLIATIVLNFAVTFSVSGISKLAHIGGFVTGVLCALALAGDPRSSRRIPTRLQIAGLGGVFVLLVIVVAVRTATFP